jgi:ssDNA-binding Zn-finger/Zn-ribbon topoisomerase 1
MSFRPEAIRGGDGNGRSGAVVDYRLTRQSVVSQYRKGRLSRLDVCDAHPELRRAALMASAPTAEECPICEECQVVLVTYAFGSRLPAGGRCITSAREMAKLSRRRDPVACYVVEVCPECAWNHLVRVFQVGG